MNISEFRDFLLHEGYVECRLPKQRNQLAEFIQDGLGFQIGSGTLDYMTRHPDGLEYMLVGLYNITQDPIVVFFARAKKEKIYSLFDTLPIYELDEPVSFWFTEDGLRQYEDAINRIADEVSENGWQLIGASIDDSMENVIYKDMFQAAFPLEYIKSKQIEYLNVNNVDEFILSAK